MEEPRPTGAPPTTRRKRRTTPYVRTRPAPVSVNDRMAYVGTVSVVDRAGAALVIRRYAIDSTADQIARWVARRMTAPGVDTAPVEPHFTYLVNHHDRMRYATMRAKGRPCESGTTKGACKSVVTMRTKRSGNAGMRTASPRR